MTSCVQYSARPGVGGIPPIVRATPRAVSFGCSVTAVGEVLVAGGNAIIFKRSGDDPLCTYLSEGATTLTGLVDADIIYVELSFDADNAYVVSYDDSNTPADTHDVYEKALSTYNLTVKKSSTGLAFLPSTTVWAAPLATYQETAGVASLLIHHEGDLHITEPMFQVGPPPP